MSPKQCVTHSKCSINTCGIELTILKVRRQQYIHNVEDMSFIHFPTLTGHLLSAGHGLLRHNPCPQEVQAGVGTGKPQQARVMGSLTQACTVTVGSQSKRCMWMDREILSKETTLKRTFHVGREPLDNEGKGIGWDFVNRYSVMCELHN